MPIQPWTKSHEKPLGDYRIFRLRSDVKVSPRTGTTHDFFVIDCVNWVNVIALTMDHQVVLVEQYRHGSNTVELEIPGGMMDTTDSNPVETAVRELREETGYEGQNARIIGRVFPNPAIMSNICYTVLVDGCHLTHPVELDSGEDVLTVLRPVEELPLLVQSGRIQHSLVVAALYQFSLYRGAPV